MFGLDSTKRQTIAGLDRPNNVDVEYGLRLGGRAVDIAVSTERLRQQLRVFRIPADGGALLDVTSTGLTRVFAGRSGEQAAPMGVALYKRPRDGAVFAIVAPKTGPRTGYLGQYRLEDDAHGRVKATFVRYFGSFSGKGEIEAVAVDDELGYIYYADEGDGIHKYPADPEAREADTELAHFGRTGFEADREGIAIYSGRAARGTSSAPTRSRATACTASTAARASPGSRTTMTGCCGSSAEAPTAPTGWRSRRVRSGHRIRTG